MNQNRTLTHKVITLLVTALFLISGPTAAYASAPQVVSNTGSAVTFQAGLEEVVANAFVGLADEVGPEVVAAITPDVEAIAARLEAAVLGIQEQKEALETKGFVINAAIPPEEQINMIPAQALAQVQAEVKAEISTALAEEFAKSEVEIQAQVKELIRSAVPQIKAELEPALKALIPKVHGIIEAKIEERIEEKILEALPDLMPLIPDEMANMSPEEIAAEMKSIIRPKIESTVRPEFEEAIKTQVDNLMVEKIKAPMMEKFQPKLSKLDSSVYDRYIDQLPGYIERVVPKSFIKAEVSKNIADLQAKLPTMVENSRGEMDSQIDEYIKGTIEQEAKIYIGTDYVEAPIQPQTVNSRLLVPFRAIATALGAEVEWKYKERQVVMTKGDTSIVLTIDSDVVLVNGKEAKIDVAAEIYQNYTIVPLRFIAETFNMNVDWQKDWKMVNMEEKQ